MVFYTPGLGVILSDYPRGPNSGGDGTESKQQAAAEREAEAARKGRARKKQKGEEAARTGKREGGR